MGTECNLSTSWPPGLTEWPDKLAASACGMQACSRHPSQLHHKNWHPPPRTYRKRHHDLQHHQTDSTGIEKPAAHLHEVGEGPAFRARLEPHVVVVIVPAHDRAPAVVRACTCRPGHATSHSRDLVRGGESQLVEVGKPKMCCVRLHQCHSTAAGLTGEGILQNQAILRACSACLGCTTLGIEPRQQLGCRTQHPRFCTA